MLRVACVWWAPFVLVVGAVMAVLSLGSPRLVDWSSPTLAFALVVPLASACAVGAAAVLAVGLRRRLAEVALLGGALWTVSVLSLAHGLLIPGTLYGANPGTMVAVMVSLPAALVAAAPVLLDGTALGGRLARHWRAWSVTWLVVPAALAVALLVRPDLVAAPPAGGLVAIAVVAVSLAGTAFLSLRHLRIYAIGRRAGSLAASIGFASAGLATIAFLGAGPMSPGWWLAHGTDIAGVLFVVTGLLAAHWRDRSLAVVLSPVLTRDPLAALELGLTPVVHRFIAALEDKDAVTRDHVVRVGELAMRAGERARLDPVALRAVGLGGLLHDVGKLVIPDAILKKPGGLTDAERATVERHTLDGEAMLAPYPHLAAVAGIVRSHHERPDGTGYPDGLRGPDIPLGAAIVSVVDAWDAMVSDRPYRAGMDHAHARSVLRDGTGTQWPAAAVDVVLAELDERGPVRAPALDRVGREVPAVADDGLVDACLPRVASIPRAA